MTREHRLNLLKLLPGLAISAFFLWYTLHSIRLSDLHQLRLVAPVWIVGVLVATCMSYGLRSYRWWLMLRSRGTRLRTCVRVFLTSLAANNILPFRLGDVMRIFTYAGDLGVTPSEVLSTVLVEKLLDVLTLVLLLFVTAKTGRGLPVQTRVLVRVLLLISAGGLAVMMAGSRALVRPIERAFAALPPSLAKLKKIEHWLLLALAAVREIGVLGMLRLLVLSIIVWCSESLLYLSAMRIIDLRTQTGAALDWGAPMQTVSLANFAFLVPSAPGGIGTFDWACQNALKIHWVEPAAAALFGLMIHVWLLLAITGTGGALFLAHRLHRARRRPLLEELDTLPEELP